MRGRHLERREPTYGSELAASKFTARPPAEVQNLVDEIRLPCAVER